MCERRRNLSTLGLQDGASEEDIRKAYKKLALQYHPDKNESDDAKGKFQEISNAYKNLTDGPRGFDGAHGPAHDLRADFLRRMFEEMFFPSFMFRGPRGFPFVFVDSDSDDDYYCYDNDDTSSDDGFMFNSYGGGYRPFQTRFSGPSRTVPTQPESTSKKKQRKQEKRKRQRERAREKKAQGGDRNQQQGSQKYGTNSPGNQRANETKTKTNPNENQPKEKDTPTQNQSTENSGPTQNPSTVNSDPTQNQSTENSGQTPNQSMGNNQSEKQSEAKTNSSRPDTPDLSRPSTPQETQQNFQKLSKKERIKMERKREQERKQIAAELLRKQEREKEKQREKEKKAEQKRREAEEEKENEEILNWFDSGKKSRKARQRDKRRQEATSTPDLEDRKENSFSNNGSNDSDDDNNDTGDGKEAAQAGIEETGIDDGQREPFRSVQNEGKSNSSQSSTSGNTVNQSRQPADISNNVTATRNQSRPQENTSNKASSSGVEKKTFQNSAPKASKTPTMTRNGNSDVNQKRNPSGPPGIRVRGHGPPVSNNYDVLDGLDDAIFDEQEDLSETESDSDVEDKSNFNYQDRGHHSEGLHIPCAKGSNQSTKPNYTTSKQNYSHNIKRQNNYSIPPQSRGRGCGRNQTRGSYSDKSSRTFDHGYRGQPEKSNFSKNEFSRDNHHFSDSQGRAKDFCPPNPGVEHEMPFDLHARDYSYTFSGQGPPNFHSDPLPPRGYGLLGGFEPSFPPRSGPFQEGPYRGNPPGFQTGPSPAMWGKGAFSGSRQDGREGFNGFHGNKTSFPTGDFKPDTGPNMSHKGDRDIYRNDAGVTFDPFRIDRKSPTIGASSPVFCSSSGGSLDSLDDFSTSQEDRPSYIDHLHHRGEERIAPTPDRDSRFESLVGIEDLGVPKGFLGDHVKNYYS